MSFLRRRKLPNTGPDRSVSFHTLFKIKTRQCVLLTFGFESSPIDGTPAKIVRASCIVSEYRRRTAPTRAIFLKNIFQKIFYSYFHEELKK